MRCCTSADAAAPQKLHSIAKEHRESVRVDFAVRCLTDFKYYQYLWVDESHVVRCASCAA